MALGLLAIVLVSALPMFLSMLKSTVVIKQQTQAKNLTQERLEQVRDLRFHVANQNGPYLDLLDIYYTDSRVAYSRPAVTVGSDVLAGQFVGTGGGTNGEPVAPYYRVTINSLSGAPVFQQVIAAQLLEADGRTVLPLSRFAAYDSQVAGADSPPSLTVGITVVTSWMQGPVQKTYRTYTQVTETRPERPVVQSQARAVTVEIGSTAVDGTSLALQGGIASLDGSQSSGSAVSGYAGGALARRTGASVVEGRNARFQLPTQPVAEAGAEAPVTPSQCAWYGFGRSSISNVTGEVTAGLPRSPVDVDDGSVPRKVITGALTDNASNACGVLGFTTVVSGGAARNDAIGTAMGASPFVRLPDAAGSAVALSGSAYVTATPLTTTPQRTYAGARSTMARPIVLFPGSPESGGAGLVTAHLTSATVDCTSGAPGTAAASYALSLRWWGKVGPAPAVASWHSTTWSYNSAANGGLVQRTGETWDPTQAVLSDGSLLSSIVTADAPVASATGAATGQRGFPNGILTLITAPTLTPDLPAGFSAVKVKLGQLTCVADDDR